MFKVTSEAKDKTNSPHASFSSTLIYNYGAKKV